MSNVSKRTESAAKLLDQLRLLGVILGLLVAAALLPLPWQIPADFADHRRDSALAITGSLDAVVLGAAALAVWVLLSWVAVIGALSVLARVPGVIGAGARRGLQWISPGLVRRTLAVGIGVGALAGITGGASAVAGTPVEASMTVSVGDSAAPSAVTMLARSQDSLAGATARSADQAAAAADLIGDQLEAAGWAAGTAAPGVPSPRTVTDSITRVPTAAPTSAEAAPHAAPVPRINLDWPVHRPTGVAGGPVAPVDVDWPAGVTTVVIVHTGDTLWDIASRALGPSATDGQIDATWHRWYAANRAVIGDDPNLILPGQHLQAPSDRTPGDAS